MHAFVFPGQGAQYSGMGKDLYDAYPLAKEMFQTADRLLQFPITDIMFNGSDEDLRQTRVTQPAVFIHSVISSRVMTIQQPDMVAGHSLGEYSALVACEALRYEDALLLVSKRALAMQKACDQQPSTMAAVLGLKDEVVSDICQRIIGHRIMIIHLQHFEKVCSGLFRDHLRDNGSVSLIDHTDRILLTGAGKINDEHVRLCF